MRTVSERRIAWGSGADAVLLPISAFGAWPVFVCLGATGVSATLCAVSLALFLCIGATAHVAFAHIGLVEQRCGAGERNALAHIARWQRWLILPQIVTTAVSATVAIVAFSVSVWQNEVCYPHWMFFANPAPLAAATYAAPLVSHNGVTSALRTAFVHCALAPLLFMTSVLLLHAR